MRWKLQVNAKPRIIPPFVQFGHDLRQVSYSVSLGPWQLRHWRNREALLLWIELSLVPTRLPLSWWDTDRSCMNGTTGVILLSGTIRIILRTIPFMQERSMSSFSCSGTLLKVSWLNALFRIQFSSVFRFVFSKSVLCTLLGNWSSIWRCIVVIITMGRGRRFCINVLPHPQSSPHQHDIVSAFGCSKEGRGYMGTYRISSAEVLYDTYLGRYNGKWPNPRHGDSTTYQLLWRWTAYCSMLLCPKCNLSCQCLGHLRWYPSKLRAVFLAVKSHDLPVQAVVASRFCTIIINGMIALSLTIHTTKNFWQNGTCIWCNLHWHYLYILYFTEGI